MLDPSPEFIGPWGTSGDPGQPRLANTPLYRRESFPKRWLAVDLRNLRRAAFSSAFMSIAIMTGTCRDLLKMRIHDGVEFLEFIPRRLCNLEVWSRLNVMAFLANTKGNSPSKHLSKHDWFSRTSPRIKEVGRLRLLPLSRRTGIVVLLSPRRP
ncbi:hypothetical protein Tco_1318651 [Tanacetum coccineum]